MGNLWKGAWRALMGIVGFYGQEWALMGLMGKVGKMGIGDLVGLGLTSAVFS